MQELFYNIIRKVGFIFSIAMGALAMVYAQPSAGTVFNPFGALIQNFNEQIVVRLTTLAVGAAVCAFFWGVVLYISANYNGDSNKLSQGSRWIGYSLLAIFVMVSLWGIIRFFQRNLLGTTGTDLQTITIPTVNFGGGGGTQQGSVPIPPGAVPTPNPAPGSVAIPTSACNNLQTPKINGSCPAGSSPSSSNSNCCNLEGGN